MKRLIGLIASRPGLVSLSLLIVSAAALIPASRLQFSTNLTSLLPEDSPAAQAYRVFLDRFGAAQQVFITIEGAETSEVITAGLLAEAASRVAEELEESPEVATARAGLDERDEASFFADIVERIPLFLEGPGWKDAIQRRLEPEYIRERVALLRSVALAPSGVVRAVSLEHDPLGFSDDLNVAALSDFGLGIDPTTLAFLSPDHSKALIIVKPDASELDPEAGRALAAIIDEAVTATASEMGLSLSAEAVGGPLFAAHDEAVIRTDLQRTLPATALACSVLLVAAFAGIGIPVAGLIALGAALVWLAAGLSLTRGGVSMVVVGFAAVLIGLGIDAAIHGGAALRRHTLAGLPRLDAALKTVQEIGPAVLTASITTAAAFAVLAFSALPPLREMGLVIAFGMAAVVVAMATLGLSLALLLSPFHGRAGGLWTTIGRLVDSVVSLAEARPRTVVVLAVLATAAAGTQITHIEVRPDLSRLRPANHPVVEAGRRLAATFGIGGDTATLLVTGDDLDQALERARQAREILKQSHPDITVVSPDQWVKGPRAVTERLKIIRRLPFGPAATLLRTEMLSSGLRPQAFSAGLSALDAFARGRDPGGDRDLLDDQLQITDDNRTTAALALRLPEDLWPDGPPPSLREAVEEVAPNALFASMPWVGADLRRLASRDLRRLSGLSLALILIVVGFSFRGRPTPTLLALTPVVLGTTWTFGLWGALGGSLDLFGLAVLPVMLGMGIDDGLYSVHGADHGCVKGIGNSVRNSGRAMVLTTLTTVIAFGSLGLSHLPSLRAAALLVPMAILACLAATLVVLPAIAVLARPSTELPGRAIPTERPRFNHQRSTNSSRISSSSPMGRAGGDSWSASHRKPTAEPNTPTKPQAPETGGLLRRLLGDFHVTGVFWYRLHSRGIQVIPEWTKRPVINICTAFFFVALRRIRSAIAFNLVPVLGHAGWWERQRRIWRTMNALAWCLTERYESLNGDLDLEAIIEGEDLWQNVLTEGRGLIVVTAHLGHWEVGAQIPMLRDGQTVHVVREAEVDPKAQELIRRLMQDVSGGRFQVHFSDEADTAFGARLLAALRRGDIVALQADRPRAGGQILTTRMFGRDFPVPLGPAALARAAQAPMVPVFIFREGRGRSRVSVRTPIEVERTADRTRDLQAAMEAVTTEIESAIRHRPHQWFCFNKVWR